MFYIFLLEMIRALSAVYRLDICSHVGYRSKNLNAAVVEHQPGADYIRTVVFT